MALAIFVDTMLHKQYKDFATWSDKSVRHIKYFHEYIEVRTGEMAHSVKSTECSSRGPRLDSQEPHGISSVTLVSGDLMSSSGLRRHQAHMCYTYMQAKDPYT